MNDFIKEKKYAIMMMIISALGFSFMAIFVKLAGDISSVQKSIFRSATIMIISGFIFYGRGLQLKQVRHVKLIAIRVIAGTLGIVLNYYAIDNLILSDANVIFRISTVLVLILSWLFLGEQINGIQLGATVLAFIGVALVVRPEFTVDFVPYAIALFGAFCAAVAYTSLRAMRGKVEPTAIVFIFSLFTTVVLAPYVLFNFQAMSALQWVYLIAAGICAAVGQYGITLAYKHAPASEVSIYNYYGVVFTTILGMLMLGQYPQWTSYLGYLVIFISSYILYRFSTKQ